MLPAGMLQAVIEPPASPRDCTFAKMSANYTADLLTVVEPCVFGGDPDCSQCGCSISTALHWIGGKKLAGVPVGGLIRGSIAIGAQVNRMRGGIAQPVRWAGQRAPLVHIKNNAGSD